MGHSVIWFCGDWERGTKWGPLPVLGNVGTLDGRSRSPVEKLMP